MPTPTAPSPQLSTVSNDTEITSAPLDMRAKFNIAAVKLAELALADENADLPEAIRAIVKGLGVKHVTWLKFSVNTSEDVTLLGAIVTYSMVWQSRYFTRRYHAIDPIFAYARSASQPFDWREVPNRSPEVDAFYADARKHDVGANGITIPVRNRRDEFTLVSLTSDVAEGEWDMLKREHMPNLRLLAVLIDCLAGKNTRLPAHPVTLSKREEESLTWAARGKTMRETADILNIGYGSVRTHLDVARIKLKCVNVTHAAAVAVAVGLIPAQALKGTDPKGYSDASAGDR